MSEEGGFAALFKSLRGGWRLEKTFSDGSRFQGNALFEISGEDSLELHEQGILALASGTGLRAERRWKWQLLGQATLIVRYTAERDGEVYHRAEMLPDADMWSGSAEHVCGADHYSANYQIGTDSLTIMHEIRGPRKALRITARFAREPNRPDAFPPVA